MTELRVALGCMRLSTDDDRDEERGLATLRAALDAGIRVFDTAHAYARDDSELGHNERLLARVVRERGRSGIRVVTKGGMRRPLGGWEPDGRARALRRDCEASLEALGGIPIDLYLLHAPDPRVAWRTSVRALAQLLEAGLVRSIGVCNVSRRQLDEALELAPIAAVQVALGPFADVALRGGVVRRCVDLGIEVLAHSPLGGPGRAAKLARDRTLAAVAARHGVTPQRVALAAIADLHPSVLPVAGARRPETVDACAAEVALDENDRAELEERYGWRAILSPPAVAAALDGEVVLVMGLQGAGKSSMVAPWVERGYARMNRDELGGSMRDLHRAMAERLAAGDRRLVADNTYATRASRQEAIAIARQHGARVAGVWLDTPVAEARRNVILRMLDVHGRLLEPEEMERARDPAALGPGALNRLVRDLEVPTPDEGFSSLEVVPFARRSPPGRDRGAVFVALDAAAHGARAGAEAALGARSGYDGHTGSLTTRLVFGWRPGATVADVARWSEAFGAAVRCCVHPAGPPRCWCRPPLPGLLVEFAERHGVDFARSTVVGTSAAHASMARDLGARFEPARATLLR
jgi:aryl-alcohol dehydrogenase-like predicted oxidoreductase/predicted kinase